MQPRIRSAALVSLVDPYPAASGKPVVLDGFLTFLAERLGHANVHYVLVGGRGSHASGEFPVPLHEVPGPTTRDRLLGLLTHGLTGRASLQDALLRSPPTGRAIRELLGRLGVDLAVYDTMRVGQHAARSGARHICYLDDLYSERYARMLAAMKQLPDVDIQPLGTFADQVPSIARPLAKSRWGQRLLLGLEQRTARRSEFHAARRFDVSLLVNSGEAARLRDRADVPTHQVQAVPPLIPASPDRPRTWRGAPEYVFLGLLSQAHNEDGARSLLREVWPRVLERRPDAKLRIIGHNARPGLQELAAQHPQSVVLEGYVPDLDSTLARAAALVNPLRFGTGVKIKVIEALCRGLPVVSTPIGADGIESGSGTGVLVGHDADGLVVAALSLLDPATNRAESTAARTHFERVYSRAAAFAAYDRAFATTPVAVCTPTRPARS